MERVGFVEMRVENWRRSSLGETELGVEESVEVFVLGLREYARRKGREGRRR